MNPTPKSASLDAEEIRRRLPHRYPFLLVDRVLHLDNERAVGLKNVTINEPHFQGHFPQRAIMPGVLIIEAMAQVAGLLAIHRSGSAHGLIAFLAGVDGARFREVVVPGDQLTIEARFQKEKARLSVASVTAKVGDKAVCEATIMIMLSDSK